ncbi:MAG TPA: adenosylhomocysteinase [Ruminococcaceae bacterium]|nr:adenosylhomocysteinase [Oscillospiraceae bacterium]
MSEIRDVNLYESGERKIQWVKANMPLLRGIENEFELSKPFKNIKIALSVHLEAKTAYLCRVLAAGGAEMYITGSNPLSTQDDVAAALVKGGLNVFAVHGATAEQYNAHLRKVIENAPNIIIDDGGDLVNLIHNEYPQFIDSVIGGCEETTTGIIRLKAMEKEGKLKFPMMAVNNAQCKYLFDNRYGTGQSVWDGINRTTNLVVAGKKVVVAGYGWCGKGVAMRAKGFGAQVIVTEIDPIKAMEAKMDGFTVLPMTEAAKQGDFFVTVTGCKDVITKDAMLNMKDGAILCNAGHFNVEINIDDLESLAVETAEKRNNIMGYKLANGHWLNLIAEGRLVNLAAGDGHPAEIMDMSFAIQSLSAKYLVEHHDSVKVGVNYVPEEIDRAVALRKLKAWGIEIDALSPSQQDYINSWNV